MVFLQIFVPSEEAIPKGRGRRRAGIKICEKARFKQPNEVTQDVYLFHNKNELAWYRVR